MNAHYDVIVIGAGSGGLTAAVGCLKIGKKVLLIEKDAMGGECTNAGCIPSKAFLHRAKTFYTAKSIAGKSARAEKYRKESFAYVNHIVSSIREEERPESFEKMGIAVIRGEAVFSGKDSVSVDGKVYQYKKVIIATGSQPRTLEIAGMDTKDVLTNQNFFDLEDVPERLLIIGGGPIGMELGQACAMLGSHVTIADINNRFAQLEDPAISEIIQKRFEELGITILLNAHIDHIENKQALFTIKLGVDTDTSHQERIAYDKVLLAIGRTPSLPQGLQDAQIAYTDKGIDIDRCYRTTNANAYAIGDVSQALKFTHTADDAARAVVTHIASHGVLQIKKHHVPKVTYTSPEIAQVGLSEKEVVTKYPEKEILRIAIPLSENDRAKTESNTGGLLVVYAQRLTGAVLGAHIIAPRAGELIALFTLAMDKKITLWTLRKTIYAYPTYALLIKKAGDVFFAQQLSDIKKDIGYTLQKHAPKLLIALFWAIGLWQLYAYKNAQNMDTLDTALMLFDFISMTIWGVLLYICIYAIRPVTFFPATALTILSGVFFGFWEGVLLTIIAANLSAITAYGVGRFFGKGMSLDDTVLGNWIVAVRENTFTSVLSMRLIFLPFDGVSYAAGILKTPMIPFLCATVLGTLLGIATFVSIGSSLDIQTLRTNGLSFEIINIHYIFLSLLVFIASVAISRVTKRLYNK